MIWLSAVCRSMPLKQMISQNHYLIKPRFMHVQLENPEAKITQHQSKSQLVSRGFTTVKCIQPDVNLLFWSS